MRRIRRQTGRSRRNPHGQDDTGDDEADFGPALFDALDDFGFGMGLMVKDVRLFLAEAEDFGIPVEVAKAVGAIWETAIKENGAESDFTTIAKTVEKRAGVEMRAKKK